MKKNTSKVSHVRNIVLIQKEIIVTLNPRYVMLLI